MPGWRLGELATARACMDCGAVEEKLKPEEKPKPKISYCKL